MDHWNALLIFDQVFRLGNIGLAVGHDLSALFEIANLHASGQISIEEIFRSEDSRFNIDLESHGAGIVFGWPKNLTWRSLEECAASLHQREFYANADVLLEGIDDEENIRKDLTALHEGRMNEYERDPSRQYLSCLEYFFEKNPTFDAGDPSALLLLLVIIDKALNPPLPPFHYGSQRSAGSGGSEMEFYLKRLHPVSRFIDLTEAVDVSDLPENPVALCRNATQYRALIERICVKAGLVDPHDYILENPITRLSGGIWSALDDSPSRFLKSHILHHNKRSSDLKKTHPSAFAAPSHNLLYDPEFIPFLNSGSLQTIFLNPLQIIDGTGYFSGISDKEYWGVIAAGGFNMALTSLLSPRGEFFGDGLPRDNHHFAMIEKARDSLIKKLRG